MGGRWRGAAVVAAGAAVLTLALATNQPARAQDDSAAGAETPGYGQAVGQLVRVDPRASGLSFGVEVGAAKAGHQQYTSRASSRVFDPGLIGLSLASESCDGGDPTWPMEDQPRAITADSRNEDDAAGETLAEPGFQRFVSADPLPLSTSFVTSEPLAIPGLLDIGEGRADARSGMEVAGIREARATVDIGGVSLLDGLVVLRGLRWESVHRSGIEEANTGSFSLGSVEIGGTPLPIPDTAGLIDAANGVLTLFGIRIGAPLVHEAGGVQFVDPLAIIIEPNPARDAVTGGVLRALQPGREALFDLLLAASCDFAPLITVIDLLVGSVTGAGTFSIELGGTEAKTEPIATPDSFGAPPGLRAGAAVPTIPAPPARPALPRPITRPAPAVAAPQPVPVDEAVEPIAAPVPDDPGRDLAITVGLATIGLGLVLVEGDRRAMRRAQRRTAAEEIT